MSSSIHPYIIILTSYEESLGNPNGLLTHRHDDARHQPRSLRHHLPGGHPHRSSNHQAVVETQRRDAMAGEVEEDGNEDLALHEHQSIAELATPGIPEGGMNFKDRLLGLAHPVPLGQPCVDAGSD